MSDKPKADEDFSALHVALGAGAITAMIALSLLAAWRLIVGWGGTVHDPRIRPAQFPQPMLERQPLADRRAYEAREAEKKKR
jgi:hypothetical protein